MGTEDAQKAAWLEQRKELLDKVRATLNGFRREARRNATMHQILSLLLLLFSILTPIASAKMSTPQAATHWADTVILLSIGVALSEGLRRLYRPDLRWRATAFIVQEIVAIRDTFHLANTQHEPGSSEWIKAFARFNSDFLAAIKRDMDDYFANSAAKIEEEPTT